MDAGGSFAEIVCVGHSKSTSNLVVSRSEDVDNEDDEWLVFFQ